MKDETKNIAQLKEIIKKFVTERDWFQYHSPKNLSMSISIEAAELMEHFQWMTTEQSLEVKSNKEKMEEIKDEVADVGIYLLNFCNVLGIDFSNTVEKKLEKSAKKYPANLVKGQAHKYTHYLKLKKGAEV
ncbi:MAG: nucleotide pyrophosphohydrolase [Candidatus Omnitrophica bacterium]|nr:nucleotide pyrophosphohydrolase [Candidatus Omnitrophota bacterium]